MKKYFGFTLSEVVLSLAIIGIIAVLTMPNMIGNYQRRVLSTQLHKVYNDMINAVRNEMTVNYASDLSDAKFFTANKAETFFSRYLKIIKNCQKNMGDCFAPSYKNINGQTQSFPSNLDSCVVSANGYSICINRTGESSNNTKDAKIFVDVNGTKGPNVIGRDAFSFCIFNDGSIDSCLIDPGCRTGIGACSYSGYDSAEAMRESERTDCESSDWNSAYKCFGLVLNDKWEIKY